MEDKEYIKSKFRCPICGSVVGCNQYGKIELFGLRKFHNHVKNCRKQSRVKPTKPGERNAD